MIFLNKYSFIISICLSAVSLNAQDLNEQFAVTIENDKIAAVDKYYTSGLFLNYKKRLNTSFIFKKDTTNVLQFNALLGNETYTPTQLSSFNTSDFDRPFAGWFFLRFEIATVKKQTALALAIETGITGRASQSGDIQRRYHRFLGIDDNPTWEQEIPFKVLINFKAKYVLNKRVNKTNALQYSAVTALGLKDTYVVNDFDYYFGKLNAFQNSTRAGLIDTTVDNEFYGIVGFGHKYVFHNTLIQGSIDYKDKTFTSAIERHLLLLRGGLVVKRKQNTFKLVMHFNTKETPESRSHTYGSLSYSRDF